MVNTRPAWVDELARKYFTRTLSFFVLHGNMHDYVPSTQGQYLRFKDYLSQEVFGRREILLTYDRAAGIGFRNAEGRKDFSLFLTGYDALHGTQYAKAMPTDTVTAFALMENYLRLRLHEGKKAALILDYAETLVPEGSGAAYNTQDRALLVFLLRWAKEKLFLEQDMTTILLTENINELSRTLIRSPYTAEIDIPFPDEAQRLAYIQYRSAQPPAPKLEMGYEILAKHTAGLNLVQLETLIAEAANGNGFSYQDLTERKKNIIESEAGGILSFVETKFDLNAVAGHSMAKNRLRAAATALKAGREDVLPMGYLVNGPVGTGKTFLISCFAAEIGVPMVELRNFRSQWVGVTESNLEKVLKLLKAMAPVAVMIDEADAYLGNRSQSGDSGVGSRVFSMIASFMSKTENRGRILWFLLTARPDLMPVDLKRQGRAEEHIALFYPETTAEKRELFEAMLRKTKLKDIQPTDVPDSFIDAIPVLSGADMEAALTRAKFRAASEGKATVDLETLRQAFEDFIPPTYPEEVELMNCVAVLECTSRALLPERYKNVPRAELLARVRELKAQLREG